MSVFIEGVIGKPLNIVSNPAGSMKYIILSSGNHFI